MKDYAHSRDDLAPGDWQGLDEHLQGTAEFARSFASVFGASGWGQAAGTLHDLGKCNPEFQKYIAATAGVTRAGPSGIDHSSAAAVLAAQQGGPFGLMLAYALCGHHGGMPDGLGDKSTLLKRIKKEIPSCVRERFNPAVLPASLPFAPDPVRFAFQIQFFIRMVFSCLVDADFLDTEAFMDPDKGAWRRGYPTLEEMADRFFPRLRELSSSAPATKVNRLRKNVLDDCLAAAEDSPGLFSLTVPTGGGKTLSSLAFALRHARRHGLSRVVYVIPYMSIIEQNAAVFRDFLGDDAVVEHHSSFDFDPEEQKESASLKRAKLAAENWDAPLIATTAVQFFESLFAAKPSRCRKLHNLARSVIILDEAQMLPRNLLLPCLEAMRELCANYGTTLVLCTATQPALDRREDFPLGLEGVREIVTKPEFLHQELKRVTVEYLGKLGDDELAGRLAGHDQVLAVVNTRDRARRLFEMVNERVESGVYHLSANMCPAHRSEIIAQIRQRLEQGLPCRVISTQLIEAGVDLDFPVVFREAAGIDSVAQAAGRCDREGLLTAAAGSPGGRVYVYEPEDKLPPGHFRITVDIADGVMRRHESDPLSPEAVRDYFRELFWKENEKLDEKGILKSIGEDGKAGMFPFRRIAKDFRLIEDYRESLIIPYDDEARKLIERLRYAEYPGGILRSLQRYTIQISPRVLDVMKREGAVKPVTESCLVLANPDIYHKELGLCPEEPGYRDPSGLIK